MRRHTDRPFVLDESDRRHRRAAARACGSGHGRGQHQDREVRRSVPGASGPRSVSHSRHRHDHRGHLGRRHRHRGDRAHGPQHAARVPVHRHRLQQLRDRQHRRRRPAPGARAHGGARRARPRRDTARRGAGWSRCWCSSEAFPGSRKEISTNAGAVFPRSRNPHKRPESLRSGFGDIRPTPWGTATGLPADAWTTSRPAEPGCCWTRWGSGPTISPAHGSANPSLVARHSARLPETRRGSGIPQGGRIR